MKSGTLGGRFTTVEGLLSDVKAQLSGSNPFAIGDSATGNKLMEFLDRLQEVNIKTTKCISNRVDHRGEKIRCPHYTG